MLPMMFGIFGDSADSSELVQKQNHYYPLLLCNSLLNHAVRCLIVAGDGIYNLALLAGRLLWEGFVTQPTYRL